MNKHDKKDDIDLNKVKDICVDEFENFTPLLEVRLPHRKGVAIGDGQKLFDAFSGTTIGQLL
uniref:Uncharacterized protein n=1 Tax=Romanomermis culicivorax TaxID=13658 RepID=A0A915ITZ2_ROMCU